MASQGEREPGVVGMDESVLESMAQDENPEQDIGVQEQFLPQPNPEPEMGAAAAAAYDIPPPLLRQSPSPAPSETATDNGGSVLLSPSVLAQMVEMFRQAMSGDMQQMKSGIDENAQQMKEEIKNKMDTNTNKMDTNTNEMRGEMKEMRDGPMSAGGHNGDATCCDERAGGECTGG